MSSVRSAFILSVTVAAGVVLCAEARAQCRGGGGGGGGGRGRGGPGGPGMNMGLALFQQQQMQQLQLLVARQQTLQLQELNRLVRELTRADPSAVEKALQSPSAETRWAAARVVALKSLPLQDQLMKMLTDPDYFVRQVARKGLVHLSARARGSKKKLTARKVDFGPVPNASAAGQSAAARKWRAWWKRQDASQTNLTARAPATVPADRAAKNAQARGGKPVFLATNKEGEGQGRGHDGKP